MNGSDAGAGNRPHTDFDVKNCTGGNCARRVEYLKASSDLLLTDLQDAVALWAPDGKARVRVESDAAVGIRSIVTGLGSLSYGELAGERMKLGVMLHDPEEEHDCFADNTHNSHYYNQVGMMVVYAGRYVRVDGTVVEGPGLGDLVATKASDAAKAIEDAMAETYAKMRIMKDTADSRVMAYDQMLAKGNKDGNAMVLDVVDALVKQAKAIEVAMKPLGITGVEFEGSDSLDDPSAVFQ